ncbi:class I adenylate-forming enzyme family protein [Halomicrococcus sp. NG-SE-24]|uniref:class I adenylate-forming enzyme family protein n=1 Tax=Halomicrococcus sp. NG-SE-24 TaxID=3436928 RepID=UPI003D97884B
MSLSIARLGDLWGDRTAVVDDDEYASYAELAARAEETAGRLAALGVGAGDAVAVVSRNRVEVLTLLFAARRLGAAFAPVPHRLTPATVTAPVERIDPAVVVHESAQRDLVRGFDRTRSFGELRHVDTDPREATPPAPDDSLLYLHVGDEEGGRVVDLPARTVAANCAAATAGWGLGRHDCTATLLPLSDADGLLRFVLPLLTVGGCVVVQRAFDPEDVAVAVERHGVTCATGGPTEFRELADEGAAETDWSSVDWLATRARVPADVREAFPLPLVRAYGRPEVGVNVLRGTAEDPDAASRPFPGVELRLAETEVEERAETGDATVGELEVRGPTTARGDLDGAPSDGWVPTGDLFRREDGAYALVGRVGERFEHAGEHVHPRIVEAVLETAPGVVAAGVVESADETGGPAPKAVVVGDVAPGALREFAEERLASHEVPRAVEVVGALPRRPTGELDRAKLRRQFETDEE